MSDVREPQRKLFGTDGVRGAAGEVLTAELALSLGRAVAAQAPAEHPQVLILRDTRESGPMLEAALAAGVAEAGGDALLAGILPTPAASILIRRLGLDLGAVISASHNPFGDNGIKFFGPDGMKLDDAAEEEVERLASEPPAVPTAFGRVIGLEGALDDYLRELGSVFQLDLAGLRVVLDCANGATFRAAPLIFERLGAEVHSIHVEPDGRNINADCGSTHIDSLAAAVAERGADIGFAFDGDGDRVLAVDREGRTHDGDELIALAALHLREHGDLPGVVVTVMTNYGFHQALEGAGIEREVTKVGDRYVLAGMRDRGWTLGGEQSGHIIWTDYAPTGDGTAAALLTLQALAGRDLAEHRPFEKLPQMLVNVRVADRDAVAGASAVWDAVVAEDSALTGRGRVLIRPSGTEPLVRVMVEAPTDEECREVCGRLVAVVERELT